MNSDLKGSFNVIDIGGIAVVQTSQDMIEFVARTSKKIPDEAAAEYFQIVQKRMADLKLRQDERHDVIASMLGCLEETPLEQILSGKALFELGIEYMVDNVPEGKKASWEAFLPRPR